MSVRRAGRPPVAEAWTGAIAERRARWNEERSRAVAPRNAALPTDAEVIGAVQRAGRDDDIVVCAAGGLPGELHKLWEPGRAGGYHLEYGFSCMGYEIAGGLGVKLAEPEREVIVMVGDGSYLMMNSEIATSVMLGQKLVIVLLDNRGFGCIDRLQRSTGSPASTTCWRTRGTRPCRRSISPPMPPASARCPRRSRASRNWRRRSRRRAVPTAPASSSSIRIRGMAPASAATGGT